MQNGTFVIMMLNLAHPSGEPKPFLLDDEDENVRQFSSRDSALIWISNNKRLPFAYAVVDLEYLDFTTA